MFATTHVLEQNDPYTVGFSGYSGNRNVRQYISDWSNSTTLPPIVDYRIQMPDTLIFGSASINGHSSVLMSDSGLGIVVYKTPQPARLGLLAYLQ